MIGAETLPDVQVELGGVALAADTGLGLSAVYVAQRLSLPALCELTFSGARAPHDLRPYSAGSALSVTIGDAAPLFSGAVTGVAHRYTPDNQYELRLRGYDALNELRKRRPVRAHVDRTVGALARELVADLALSVQLHDDGPARQRVMQWQQSDLELLSSVAARSGLYFDLHGGTLTFVTLAGAGEAVPLELGLSLLEAELDTDPAAAPAAVDIRAWDPWTAVAHAAAADEPRAARADVSRGAGAAAHEPGPQRLTLVDRIAQSEAEAGCCAQAELDRRAAATLTVRGIAVGDPKLRPGRRVELVGAAPDSTGPYALTEVVHTVDRRQGYRSAFDTAPPPVSTEPHATVTTFGVVVGVDDPERLGRVRVTLPNYCDIETDWLAVVMPGGGAGKGLVALPDLDDRVLLLLPREDPAQGIVLGGLYGLETPPDEAGVDGGRVQSFSYTLPGGQRLHLDQDKHTVRLENGGDVFLRLAPGNARLANNRGSYVELDDDCVRVHANADLELTAPGRSVVFRSAKVDFQTG